MTIVYSPYALACLVSGLITAVIALKIRRVRSDVPGAGTFTLALASGTAWSLTEAVILST